MKSYELWFFPKMRKNKYLSPFTSLKSAFYFLEAVVGALPVAHEPTSFSFSLLLLSFTLVALSLVALDFALCLTKDRGGQRSLSFNIVSTQVGRVPMHQHWEKGKCPFLWHSNSTSDIFTCVRNRLQELHLCRVKHLQVRHSFVLRV